MPTLRTQSLPRPKENLCCLLIPIRQIEEIGWSNKARRRKTTGVGRCAYLKLVKRREANGFMEGNI
ncbi:ribosomal protein L37 [Acrasis kona]|uniref:Ribosomal protein L37 n=1 Tax=Acrasis kona TaxID=1008807 RepID=A0AAW2YKJ1_9EUKA